MFGISGEHLIILGVVLLFFGPRRLPELGHTLGKAIRNFKDATAGIEEATYRKVPGPQADEQSSKNSKPTEG
ncbi:MAG: twin-arginine translocase TatA/TatE family subunit [Oligoflexia bacterium]|jgi:sec-independent protein translocase protein TatA